MLCKKHTNYNRRKYFLLLLINLGCGVWWAIIIRGLYGVRYMVKDHSDNERGNLLLPHRLFFPISSMVLLYASEEEENVLFNDALNTYYLRLYGIGHMVKDHSDSERGNPLPPHGLLFPILYASSHRQDNTYHSLCYTSRGALAGTRTDLLTAETHQDEGAVIYQSN